MGWPLNNTCRIWAGANDSGSNVGGSDRNYAYLRSVTSLCFHAGDFVQLPVPIIQQLYHWDCGLACSRMVLR